MLSTDDMTQLKQAFLLGLSRRPVQTPKALKDAGSHLKNEQAEMLTGLALMAQRQRFGQRVMLKLSEPTAPKPKQPQDYMAEPLRQSFRNLLTKAKADKKNDMLIGIDAVLAEKAINLHPYDLSLVVSTRQFVRSEGALGHWVRQQTGQTLSATTSYSNSLIDSDMNEDNWTDYGSTTRAAYISTMRESEPEKARILIENVWGGEAADVRLKLIETLETGLSLADKDFLNTRTKDRSGKVKAVLNRLLTMLPDEESTKDDVVDKIADMLVLNSNVTSLGKAKIQLKQPKKRVTVKAFETLVEQFSSVSLAKLAKAFNLSESDFIAALDTKALFLMEGLLARLIRNKAWQHISPLLEHYNIEHWSPFKLSFDLEASLKHYNRQERKQLFEIILNYTDHETILTAENMVSHSMFQLLDGSATKAFMQQLRQTKGWEKLLTSLASEDKKKKIPMAAQILDGITLLVPPGCAKDYLADLDKFELKFTCAFNRDYWLFLTLLES